MPIKDRLKAVAGAVGALLTCWGAVWADHTLDSAEIGLLVGLVLALGTAVGVYHTKNQPSEG